MPRRRQRRRGPLDPGGHGRCAWHRSFPVRHEEERPALERTVGCARSPDPHKRRTGGLLPLPLGEGRVRVPCPRVAAGATAGLSSSVSLPSPCGRDLLPRLTLVPTLCVGMATVGAMATALSGHAFCQVYMPTQSRGQGTLLADQDDKTPTVWILSSWRQIEMRVAKNRCGSWPRDVIGCGLLAWLLRRPIPTKKTRRGENGGGMRAASGRLGTRD